MINLLSEANIFRVLGASALALAFVVTIVITMNSGILGGDDNARPSEPAATEIPAVVVDPATGEAAPAPAPAAEAPAAPAGETAPITLETQTYIIEGGDSFFSIATKFNTTIDELQRLNPSVNPQNLSPGTELVVPKAADG